MAKKKLNPSLASGTGGASKQNTPPPATYTPKQNTPPKSEPVTYVPKQNTPPKNGPVAYTPGKQAVVENLTNYNKAKQNTPPKSEPVTYVPKQNTLPKNGPVAYTPGKQAVVENLTNYNKAKQNTPPKSEPVTYVPKQNTLPKNGPVAYTPGKQAVVENLTNYNKAKQNTPPKKEPVASVPKQNTPPMSANQTKKGIIGPYAKGVAKDGARTLGLGLLNTNLGGTKVDAMNLKFKAGKQEDGQYGVESELNMIKFGPNYKDGVVRPDGGFLNATANASAGEKGLKVEWGASVAQGAVRFGDINSNETDTQVRIGGSLVGVGGRFEAIREDSDGDGLTEVGVGIEGILGVGPSVDIRTEVGDVMQKHLDKAIDNAAKKIGLKQALINIKQKLTAPTPANVSQPKPVIQPAAPAPMAYTAPTAQELAAYLKSMK